MALESIPAAIKSLASRLVSRANRKRPKPTLIELEHGTDRPMLDRTFEFQYWPAEIQIAKPVNYASTEIIGGNLPLHAWTGGGEFTIGFNTFFTCDMDLLSSFNFSGAVPPSNFDVEQRMRELAAAGEGERNRDLRDVLAYFARFQLGHYDVASSAGGSVTMPPRKVLLILPNMGLGQAFGFSELQGQGVDAIPCIIKQADPTITAAFSSGLPRILSYNFSFSATAQIAGDVNFPKYTAARDEQIALKGRWRVFKGG